MLLVLWGNLVAILCMWHERGVVNHIPFLALRICGFEVSYCFVDWSYTRWGSGTYAGRESGLNVRLYAILMTYRRGRIDMEEEEERKCWSHGAVSSPASSLSALVTAAGH